MSARDKYEISIFASPGGGKGLVWEAIVAKNGKTLFNEYGREVGGVSTNLDELKDWAKRLFPTAKIKVQQPSWKKEQYRDPGTRTSPAQKTRARDPVRYRYGRLPVRPEVTEVEYHRPPTRGELSRGYGATHYRTFSVEEASFPGTRFLKNWFRADDGLRYYL